MQLLGSAHLQLREVEAFNQMGDNVALNKIATQSSTWGSNTASKAVDGDKVIGPERSTSITNYERGKYQPHILLYSHTSHSML